MTWISSIFSAIGGFFSWMAGRSAANNTPEMKQADSAQKDADEAAEEARIIKERDAEAARRRLSMLEAPRRFDPVFVWDQNF